MIPVNRTLAPLQAFVDELARCGLAHAVTSPGSRNAPILLALAGEPRVRSLSVLDERSAGFTALGMAKASDRPVVVTTTSGTAAANLLPAVVEALEARVPLIVLTADRPPELRGVGEGQAIDQLKLYGSAVKWFVEVGSHEPGRATAIHHRALACRAYFTAGGGRPGPVHLNFPLREPLAPVAEELDAAEWDGRPDGRPWVELRESPGEPGEALVGELAAEWERSPRGALVCGPTSARIAEPAARLAAASGWPILAEPTSGARCGRHDRSRVVAHYDALLRSERFAAGHRPDLVVRIGDTPTSKPLRAWLESGRQIVIDPHSAWHEPTRAAETVVAADPAATCERLAQAVAQRRLEDDGDWLESWRAADRLVPQILARAPDPFEPKAYAALAEALPGRAAVWVGSSMPIRDVETFFPQSAGELRFMANRGANGIDGVVSSALGAAVASGERCYLLTGELALLHDLGGLLAARRHGVELTILCVNNGGGGIFDFLPVAEHAEAGAYEEHIATPSDVELADVAAAAGIRHLQARSPDEVRAAVAEPGLVEVRTDRAANVELHRRVFAEVAEGLGGR
jgi:2-succinyl-5-enolpyruvyl-6-hydroxy-3-cyclohexene-1-carboxylate synthase